jgi:hypothetical protein
MMMMMKPVSGMPLTGHYPTKSLKLSDDAAGHTRFEPTRATLNSRRNREEHKPERKKDLFDQIKCFFNGNIGGSLLTLLPTGVLDNKFVKAGAAFLGLNLPEVACDTDCATGTSLTNNQFDLGSLLGGLLNVTA